MDIALNSLVTFSAQGQAGSIWQSIGVTDVQTAVTTSLRNYGLAPVLVALTAASALPQVFTFQWSGTIAVRPSYTTDDASLPDQVASAVQDATGYPATVSLQSVDDASTPNPTAPTTSMLDTILTPVKAAVSAVTSETNSLLIGLAIVGVILVLTLGYAPNVKKLATVSL
jgi:hypothetical protein